MKIVNSSLFIWILGTPFLGFFVWWYHHLEDSRKQEALREKITNEIEYRVERSQVEATTAAGAESTLAGLEDNSLNKEFEKIPLNGLFWQLIPLCDSAQTKDQVQGLIQAYESLPAGGDEKDRFKAYRAFQQRVRTVIRPLLPKTT